MSRVAALWEEWEAEDGLGDLLLSSGTPLTFPGSPLGIRVSLALGADPAADPTTDFAWTFITDYVELADAGIEIHRGRTDWQTQVQPSWCTLRVDNADGRFSRLNPTGAYYGQLAKNTPIRVEVNPGTGWVTRFVGFVSEWPPRWTPGGKYHWVRVRADGVLRRLTQGPSPVRSPLTSALLRFHNEVVTPQTLAVYWPMEPGSSSASRFNSVIPGQPSMTVSGEAPAVGDNGSGPLLGSDRIPILGSTTSLTGTVPPYSAVSTGLFAVLCVLDVPDSTGWSDNTAILKIQQSTASSTVDTWEIRYKTGGDLEVRALDESGAELDTTGTLDANIDGKQVILIFDIATFLTGTNLALRLFYLDDTGVIQDDLFQDFFSLVPAIATRVRVAPAGGLDGLAIGQIAVDRTASIYSAPFVTTLAPTGFAGETDVDRFNRVCDEAGIPYVTATGDDIPLGSQAITDVVAVLREGEAAGHGVLDEALDGRLAYQPLSYRYNLPVSLALDHDQGHIVPPFEPADDDQFTRNDVTVIRVNGASARATDEASIAAVGRYDQELTLSLYLDSQALDHAGWMLNIGTVDEYRYPTVELMFHKPAMSSVIAAWLACDISSRLTIDNMPANMPPDLVEQIIEGYTERISALVYQVTLNLSPARPFDVGKYQDTVPFSDAPRYDTEWSTTSGAFVTGTDTTMTVATSVEPLWTLAPPGGFPILIRVAGAVLSVSNITGASSPQTFTISTTVANGVVKTIPSGSQVRVYRPGRYAL